MPADALNGDAPAPLVVLRLFAGARQAAGTAREEVRARSVGAVIDDARRRHGDDFAQVLEGCRIWLNGAPALPSDPVDDGDEVAVLPPVSGGAQ